MSEGFHRPPDELRDAHLRKRNRNGNWAVVEAPQISYQIADSHAHIQMLVDPSLALARAAANGITFIEAMADPTDDEGGFKHPSVPPTYMYLDKWLSSDAASILPEIAHGAAEMPKVRISVGVHPHNASAWNEKTEELLVSLLKDERTSALGEIGLDYHYDYSPREDQRRVFARQIEIAKEAGLPLVLHVREAYDDAFSILDKAGWSNDGVLLHCYTSDANEIKRWVEAGCFIAFGGALTFNRSDDIRSAFMQVPLDRLLVETDAPYMAPTPFRGNECEPTHVLWTESYMAELLGNLVSVDELYERLYDNAIGLLDRPATSWQLGIS